MKKIKRSVVFCLWVALSGSTWADKPMNVLFLMVDDLNTWLLGDADRYAGKVVAPNIRKLADSGVLFERTYTASPYCSPSRTALLSGVSPWKSGVYDNGVNTDKSPALEKATSFPMLFKQAGYYTASYGKVEHGWGASEAWDDRQNHKRDPVPPGAPLSPAGGGENDWGPTHLKESEMNDTKYANRAIEQLEKKHDRPFFIACGLFHPHMPQYVPQKYLDLFPLDEIVLPELKKGDLDDLPPLAIKVLKSRGTVDKIIELGEHKKLVQGYLASTAFADAQMGRVLDALDKSPYRDNTIVVLMSDNGYHLGEKNHLQKATLWEEATHVNLMFRVPGLTKAGGVSERFVSLQDLYPTLTELCALKKPDYVDGKSLVPLLKNPNAEWQSTAISSIYDQFIAIRNEKYRYIRYSDEQEEFYDCSKDPHEWTNLINNPEYAAEIKKVRALVPTRSEMTTAIPSRKGGGVND